MTGEAAQIAQADAATNVVWRLDAAVQRAARDSALQAMPVLGQTARAVNSWGGDGVIWFAAVLWLGGRAIGRGAWARVGLRGAEAIAVGSAVSGIIKGLAGRARPFMTPGEPWHWDFNHGWSDARYFSMPSGHTTATVAFVTAVVLATTPWTVPRRMALVLPLMVSAVLVGASRIFTNQHWLTDVVAAVGIGMATAVALVRVHNRADARRDLERPSRYHRLMLGAKGVAGAAGGRVAPRVIAGLALAAGLLSLVPNVAAAQGDSTGAARTRGPIATRSDAMVLGGAAAASALLIGWDRTILDDVRGSALQGNDVIRAGLRGAGVFGDPGTVLVAAGLWINGHVSENRTQRLVGLRALEGIIASGVATGAIKALTGRARPDHAPGMPRDWVLGRGVGDRSEFQSFPSGHATAAFAFASAVDAEWARLSPKRPRWVAPALYGVATLTAVSRVYRDRHWASDVVMGSAIGFVGGRAVVRWHADRR